MSKPRAPTDVELVLFYMALFHEGQTPADPETLFAGAYISVHDDYITGCPGYSGPVAVIIWDASPHTISVLTIKTKAADENDVDVWESKTREL